MAGNRRSSTLSGTTGVPVNPLGMAGNRRSSTLMVTTHPTPSRLGMAGNRRSSTLPLLCYVETKALGMAGNRRSSTLDRAEPTEKQWVGAVLLFKKEESAPESLLDRSVFSHRKPPFCRIAGLSQ